MRLLLLDKDGTLTRPRSGQKFVQHPEDQELIPGVAQALDRWRADGWLPVIISNQGGVFARHKTLEDAIAEMKFACELTGIQEALFCPCDPNSPGDHFVRLALNKPGQNWYCGEWDAARLVQLDRWKFEPGELAGFRKPNPGMLIAACALQATQPIAVVMVGDRPEDKDAAHAAGNSFMWNDEWVNTRW